MEGFLEKHPGTEIHMFFTFPTEARLQVIALSNTDILQNLSELKIQDFWVEPWRKLITFILSVTFNGTPKIPKHAQMSQREGEETEWTPSTSPLGWSPYLPAFSTLSQSIEGFYPKNLHF